MKSVTYYISCTVIRFRHIINLVTKPKKEKYRHLVFPRVPLNISLRTQFLYYNLVEAFGGTPGITGELIMHDYQRLGTVFYCISS
jgi:hypothetical protein